MRLAALFASLLAALVVAGHATAADRGTLTVHGSDYGRVLYDGKGFVLYAFTHDPKGKSACTGACAAAWPPFLVRRSPGTGTGARSTLLGTTRRADGTLQVTYRGRPLYYYVGDRNPGQILCQNVSEFGGRWLVVRPDGTLVR